MRDLELRSYLKANKYESKQDTAPEIAPKPRNSLDF